MIKQDEVHGDVGGHEMKIIKLNLEKKKEKNKKTIFLPRVPMV